MLASLPFSTYNKSVADDFEYILAKMRKSPRIRVQWLIKDETYVAKVEHYKRSVFNLKKIKLVVFRGLSILQNKYNVTSYGLNILVHTTVNVKTVSKIILLHIRWYLPALSTVPITKTKAIPLLTIFSCYYTDSDIWKWIYGRYGSNFHSSSELSQVEVLCRVGIGINHFPRSKILQQTTLKTSRQWYW